MGNAAEHASAIMFAMKDKLVSLKFFDFLFLLICVALTVIFSIGHFFGSGNRVINADIHVWGGYSSDAF